ncbi:twinkle protein, mitochondrial isoform X3 [Sipha flava]|nr:twinkle protein, mitochondrial isoform X3 [Sipha flava]
MHFKSLKTDSKRSILKSLNMEGLQLKNLDRIPGLYVNLEINCLYLTMLLDNKTVVGYQEIKLDSLDQSINPSDCCYGIACVPPFISNPSQSAIIVDDFKHLLVLTGRHLFHHIICLPHGLRKLPQELLPSLEHFKKLILWFGNDQIAWNSARTFAKKLIENRCYFIRPTDDQPSPYLANKLGLNIEQIIKTADQMVHPSIIQFSTIRKEVLAELQNHDKTLGIKWTKFPVLNKIIGGHRRGELTIITGPTGSGKTTFMSEYSLDLAEQGLPTLWGSFEIRNQRLAKIMLQQFAKEPVHLNLDLFDNLANKFEKLPIYFLTFHGPQPLNMVMDAVVNAVYVHDIGHVVIDNVQFMMGISTKYDMGSERFWQQDSIIAEFRRFATYSNCHVTLVMHPRKEKDVEQLSINSIFGTAKATQEADNVLIIQHKVMESLQIKKYLQISKNRYNGNLGLMPLEFNKHRLSFSQEKD